jgi:O-acetyl-ADP-ribose deacetylase (regulator of RNase III)/ADP-ribose pyrophosphatase YjhB (NUDIX family)
MRIGDCEIRIMKGDITELDVDAIVNAANNKLIMGGGVAGAIKRKGGSEIEEEAAAKGPIEVGQAVATKAGKLKCRYVIHAATMGMDFKTDERKVRSSAYNALKEADRLNIKSIAFPALGCGVGGFPNLASAKIMSQEVLRYLHEDRPKLKEIVFCLYDKEAYDAFDKGVLKYLTHFAKELERRPFTTVDIIIEVDGAIVLIERSNPPFGMALPGGFVDYGESLEEAAIREAKEETGLGLAGLKQFHTYSDPERDPRFHTIGTVFIAKGEGKPKAGDDAKAVKLVKLDEIDEIDLAFDHKKILADYIKYKKGTKPFYL